MVLLSGELSEALEEEDCMTMDVAPQVCSVLDAFDLSPASFRLHIEGVVPVNDAAGQAACGDAR